MVIDTPYLFEHPFDVESIISEHKDKLIEKFIHDKVEGNCLGLGFNTYYESDSFNREISKRFVKAVDKCFHINRDIVVERDRVIGTQLPGDEFRPIKPWIYCQNDTYSSPFSHCHIETSTINAVTYCDVPSEGGALELEILGETIELVPEPNKIYFFPYWVVHRPLPQKDKEWRLCINLEFYDINRALRKNGVRW